MMGIFVLKNNPGSVANNSSLSLSSVISHQFPEKSTMIRVSISSASSRFIYLMPNSAPLLRGFVSSQTSLHHLRSTQTVLPLHHRRSLCRVSATNDEEASAKAAAVNADKGGPTIFDKIISKEIPSTIVYEDEKVLAFRDINPQAPVHVVLIPKFRDGLTELGKAEARHCEILGHLLYAAKIVAEKEGIKEGFRVVINNGPDGCQSVYHLHLHVLGGRQLKWPPG